MNNICGSTCAEDYDYVDYTQNSNVSKEYIAAHQ